MNIPTHVCPCGPCEAVDEDRCCVTCGGDAIDIRPFLKAEREECAKIAVKRRGSRIAEAIRKRTIAAPPKELVLSKEERGILQHACGWPKRYRNHFAAAQGSSDYSILQDLDQRGLVEISGLPDPLFGGLTFFAVTDTGFAALEAQP